MPTYTIRNYESLKKIGTSNSLINARKRVYKELMAHKRSRFSIENETSIDTEGLGFGEYEGGRTLFQSYKKGVYMGAYYLYKDGSIKRM